MVVEALSLLDIELEHLVELPDGRTVEWEALGRGDPLIWVEGGPGLPAHLARADVVPVLERFRCHLVNAPGSGRTSAPRTPGEFDLVEIAGFFEATRRALGLGPVTVMGHSWGGLIAPAWAALHPAGVERLVVISGYAGGSTVDPAVAGDERDRAFDRLRDRPWFEAAFRHWQEDFDRRGRTEAELVAGFRTLLPLYFADPEHPVSRAHIERIRRELRFYPPIVDAWIGEREDADYRPLFARIRCPTLVITGEHDWICGPAWNRALADAIPGSRYVVVPGVGHLPQYEAPDRFLAIIEEWLAS